MLLLKKAGIVEEEGGEKEDSNKMIMIVANPKVSATINYMATFQKAKSVSVNFSFKFAWDQLGFYCSV